MHSRLAPPVLALLSALALAACGDDAPPPIAYQDFAAEYAEAMCDFAQRCPVAGYEGGSYASLAAMPPDVCVEVAGATFADGLPYDAPIASGTITFDENAAGECIDSIARDCGGLQIATFHPSCVAMFQGTVAAGGSCAIDEECADGGYCMRTEVDTCGGICVAGAELGAACGGAGPDCSRTPTADGRTLVCLEESPGEATRCTALRTRAVTQGKTCGPSQVDGDEVTFTVCRSTLYCRVLSGTTGTCEAPLAEWAGCSTTSDACAIGATCSALEDGTAVCAMEPVLVSEVGAPCSALAPCNPAIDLTCEDGLCQRVVRGAVGAECAIGRDGCEDGLYCRRGDAESPAVCAALLTAGTECRVTDGSCESGICDDSVEPAVCAPVVPVCF